MIDKRKLPTDLELAKGYAAWFINKDENKDILVTLPDGGVYLNLGSDKLEAHCLRNKLKIVVVKENGKVKGEQEEETQIEEVKPKSKKK